MYKQESNQGHFYGAFGGAAWLQHTRTQVQGPSPHLLGEQYMRGKAVFLSHLYFSLLLSISVFLYPIHTYLGGWSGGGAPG